MTDDALPEAELAEAHHRSWAWLVPVLALVAAVAFLARAWDQRGAPITIHLQDGAGIKAGDALRYRGIEVGEVREVRLARGLGGVDVRVVLEESSRDLARTGSSFWVVRPRIEAGTVSGLDTLVGARYLAVEPGPEDAARATHFVGLEEAPLRVAPGALELVLEADAAGGVARGAPVTYRRLPVGRVLSVGLSGDSRQVEVRVVVDAPYRGLVLENTRFFETSGLDLQLGLAGVELSIDSLEALIAGGVGLATPEESAAPATTGARFALHSQAEAEWLTWRPALAAAGPETAWPRPTRARLTWESGLLQRDREREGWALWVEGGLLGPADLVTVPEGAHEGAATLEVAGATLTLTTPAPADGLPLLVAPLTAPGDAPAPWSLARTIGPDAPVDCVAIADAALAPLALDAAQLTAADDGWHLDPTLPVAPTWHGAVVVTRETNALVGLLLLDEGSPRVALLPW